VRLRKVALTGGKVRLSGGQASGVVVRLVSTSKVKLSSSQLPYDLIAYHQN